MERAGHVALVVVRVIVFAAAGYIIEHTDGVPDAEVAIGEQLDITDVRFYRFSARSCSLRQSTDHHLSTVHLHYNS